VVKERRDATIPGARTLGWAEVSSPFACSTTATRLPYLVLYWAAPEPRPLHGCTAA
jgi:hypothetical protein